MTFDKISSSEYRQTEKTQLSDSEIISRMRDSGLENVPTSIEYDGRIHRFRTGGSRKDDKAGWYIAEMVDGIKMVNFGDWRTDAKGFINGYENRNLSKFERMKLDAAVKRHAEEMEKQRKEYQAQRITIAQEVWTSCPESDINHPYIIRKRLSSSYGTKLSEDGRLVVPMFGEDGAVQSLQFIDGDGTKRFFSGAPTKKGFWWLGDAESTRVFLCEGFATASSIFEQTGATTFMSFSAGNLPSVASMLKAHGKEVTVVADNDANGKGMETAEKAKEITGCSVILIPNKGNEKVTDANDYQNTFGDLRSILPNLLFKSKMIMARDLLHEPLQVKWLVKNWIPVESIGMFHGPSACGKTNMALDLLLSVSCGQSDWHGFKIREPRKVVYLCGEGLTGVKKRIRAWLTYKEVADPGDFAIFPLPLDLDSPQGELEIRENIDSLPWRPDIIVIDTVNRYMSGDENSAQDTRIFLNAVDRIRTAYSCTGLYIHHTGNDENAQNRGRGSSAWRGALDFEVSIHVDQESGCRVVQQVKMKDSELGEPMFGFIKGVEIPGELDEDGDIITGSVFDVCDPPESIDDKALNEAVTEVLMVLATKTTEGRLVTRDKWKEYLVESKKVADMRAATKYLSDTRSNRTVGRLEEKGVITRLGESDSWWVEDVPATHMQLGFMGRLRVEF